MNNYMYYEIPICNLTSGLKLSLPVHEIIGKSGPVVGITASIHGDERIGVEVVRRLVALLRENEINGTIKMIPVVNPLAFEDINRNTTLDGKNINRIFPGSYNGTVTDLIAKNLADKFISGLDVYIDVHSAGRDPVVDYIMITNDEGLSKAGLAKILYRPAVITPGTSSAYAVSLDIPNVVLELGGGIKDLEYLDINIRAIVNMLKYKGVVSGTPESREDQITVNYIEHLSPKNGGLYVPCISYDRIATIVEGEVTLGKIYNPMTLELIEEMKTPYDRNLIILMRGSVNTVYPGDYAFMIGNLNSAEGNF